MILHCVLRDVKDARDFAVPQTAMKKFENLSFPPRQFRHAHGTSHLLKPLKRSIGYRNVVSA